MKHMCAPSSAFSISAIVSSAAALPISGTGAGAEALRDLEAELDAAIRGLALSACASVLATMKSTP
jgi:hypothetical protein